MQIFWAAISIFCVISVFDGLFFAAVASYVMPRSPIGARSPCMTCSAPNSAPVYFSFAARCGSSASMSSLVPIHIWS